jgi:hypothetical protein
LYSSLSHLEAERGRGGGGVPGAARAAAQLFEVLRHKPEGREFDFRWNVSLT